MRYRIKYKHSSINSNRFAYASVYSINTCYDGSIREDSKIFSLKESLLSIIINNNIY